MNRMELCEAIIKGMEYLQQDRTPEERKAAESKLAKYRAQLREMDGVPEPVEESPAPETPEETEEAELTEEDRSLAFRAAIRAMLKKEA